MQERPTVTHTLPSVRTSRLASCSRGSTSEIRGRRCQQDQQKQNCRPAYQQNAGKNTRQRYAADLSPSLLLLRNSFALPQNARQEKRLNPKTYPTKNRSALQKRSSGKMVSFYAYVSTSFNYVTRFTHERIEIHSPPLFLRELAA